MTEWRSPEQMRAQQIKRMGVPLGEVYNELFNQVVWLHAKWDQYRKLWFVPPEQRTLLFRAVRFFVVVTDALHDDVVLHLARLTEPQRRGKNERLTLRILPEHAELDSQLEERIKSAELTSKFATISRNNRIAHMNLEMARAGEFPPNPFPCEVEEALQTVRAVMEHMETQYGLAEDMRFEPVFPGGADFESLMYYLERGVRAEEEEVRRLLHETPSADKR